MKIYTARFTNKSITGSGLLPVRITLGAPRFKLPYKFAECIELAPARSYFEAPFDEFRRQYRQGLQRMGGVERIVAKLQALVAGKDVQGVVLLCYEDTRIPEKWCHRDLLAEFLREYGIAVEELPEPEAQAGAKLPKGHKHGGKAEFDATARAMVQQATMF